LRVAKKSAKSGKPRASPLKKAAAPRKKVEEPTTTPAATVAQPSKYAIGDRVSHPMFGDGSVTAIDSNRLTIQFSNDITKQIVDDYVKHRKR
jgi:DNA helicase II / ATP-dependent DNA helicase PcrA